MGTKIEQCACFDDPMIQIQNWSDWYYWGSGVKVWSRHDGGHNSNRRLQNGASTLANT